MNYGLYDILQLFGSLGLFLFGMMVMSDALLKLAGSRMRGILASMTSNRFLGVLTGFSITSVIQSSSATTLMVVSFSNASLLTLTEAISVIMGANIGTTVTAWLITILGFKVSMSAIALPLVGLGLGFTLLRKESLKNWGTFIIGFAILFIGLEFLKDAVPDIKNNPDILAFLTRYTDLGYWSVLLFLLIGTLLTLVVQSSSATMALTLVMTAQGWIPFELAAAMVLGQNIGTTITANLAAIVGNYLAKRTALAHLFFNIFGVCCAIIVFYPFMKAIDWLAVRMGSDSPYVSAAAIPVALSVFHTIFNVCNTLVLVWFVQPIARLVEWMVPTKVEPEKAIEEPKFLNKEVLDYPETFIASLEKESKYLFKNAIFEIVAHALNIHRSDIKSKTKLKQVIMQSHQDMGADVQALYHTKVKKIYGEILRYATLGQSKLDLSPVQTKRVTQLKIANRKMVEVVKMMNELRPNTVKFISSDNEYVKAEYERFRRRIAKVLRTIYLFRQKTDKEKYHRKLIELGREADKDLDTTGKDINRLIRNELVTVDMGSSLVNDHDNVNDTIENLITIADLLYGEEDPLLSDKKPV